MASTIQRALSVLRFPLSVALGGTGKTTEFRKGYIDGLRMVYQTRTSFLVTAGSVAAPDTGNIITLAADATVSPSLSATAFHHIYMYDTGGGVGAIEVSTTVPVRYFGTAYNKTGDTSRRYLGTLLTNPSSQLWGFRHEANLSRMMYIENAPGVLPFPYIAGFSTGGVAHTTTNALSVVPKETTLAVITSVSCPTSTNLAVAPADSFVTVSLNNWDNIVGITGGFGGIPIEVCLSRTPATMGQFQMNCNAAVTMYCRGYTFER